MQLEAGCFDSSRTLEACEGPPRDLVMRSLEGCDAECPVLCHGTLAWGREPDTTLNLRQEE